MKPRILLCVVGAAALSVLPPQRARTTRLQAQKAENRDPSAPAPRRAPKKKDDPRRRKTPELFEDVKGPGIHLKKKTRGHGPGRRLAPAQSRGT